jgi:hypothetical protein
MSRGHFERMHGRPTLALAAPPFPSASQDAFSRRATALAVSDDAEAGRLVGHESTQFLGAAHSDCVPRVAPQRRLEDVQRFTGSSRVLQSTTEAVGGCHIPWVVAQDFAVQRKGFVRGYRCFLRTLLELVEHGLFIGCRRDGLRHRKGTRSS